MHPVGTWIDEKYDSLNITCMYLFLNPNLRANLEFTCEMTSKFLLMFLLPCLCTDEDTPGVDGVEQGALFEDGARSHGRGGRGEEAEDDTTSGNRPAQENYCNCLIHTKQTNKQTNA